jgi:hypothetical protein
LISDDFHALCPRILYGFALDDQWRVDAMSLEIGEFVEVMGRGGMVMAQGRVSSLKRVEKAFSYTITLTPVTTLELLEAATCQERR